MPYCRAVPSVSRLVAALMLVATGACASSSTVTRDRDRISTLLDSVTSPEVAGVPRVLISTDDDVGRNNRIITRMRVQESAYVVVVNVSPSGYASVVFPEQPDEAALLLGGKTYVLPSHFTGYHWTAVQPAGAHGTRAVWYGRSSNARLSAQGPGYIFVIASRSPLNLDALALEGYFDGVEVGTTLAELDPEAVVPKVALVALTGTERGAVSVDYARYSGYDPVAYMASAFRSSYNTAYCGSNFDRSLSYHGIQNYLDLGYVRGGCSPLDMWLFRGRAPSYPVPGIPGTPPVRPAPPDSGGTVPPDSGSVTPPRQKPRPILPTTPDSVRPATSAGERRVVNAATDRDRVLRPDRLPIARDEVVLTHSERQRAVQHARERLRAGLENGERLPVSRHRARPAADRPNPRDPNPVPRVTAGSASSETQHSSPPPATRSAEPRSAPTTRGAGAPKPEPTSP